MLHCDDIFVHPKVSSTHSIHHNLIYDNDSFSLNNIRQDDKLYIETMRSYTHLSSIAYNNDNIHYIFSSDIDSQRSLHLPPPYINYFLVTNSDIEP